LAAPFRFHQGFLWRWRARRASAGRRAGQVPCATSGGDQYCSNDLVLIPSGERESQCRSRHERAPSEFCCLRQLSQVRARSDSAEPIEHTSFGHEVPPPNPSNTHRLVDRRSNFARAGNVPRAVPFRFVALADPPAELASVSAWAVQSLRESNSHALRCRVQAVPCVHVQLSHTIVQQQPYAERRTQSKNRKAEGVMHLFIRARAKEGSGLVVALLKSSTSGSTLRLVFVDDWQRWCRGAPQRRRLGLALPPLPCFGRSRPGAVLTDCKSAGHQQRINSITTG
jgi:hypothetical protein